MRVRVAGLAWMEKKDLTDEQLRGLRTALTVMPSKVGDYGGGEVQPIFLFEEDNLHIGIARSFFQQNQKPRHEVILELTDGRKDLWAGPVEFAGNLREEQRQAVNVVTSKFRGGQFGGLVRAVPGFGKTVIGLAIAAEMNVPTLIVVHKEFLVSQWAERIEQFVPGAKIGYAQQDRCDYAGKNFVIGMVHSLAAKEYPLEFYEWPGLVIVDESVPEQSRVLTETGYRKIGDIVADPDPVRVVAYDAEQHRFELRHVTKKWVHAPKSPLLRITHEKGVLECTANHEVLTPLGYVRAGKLLAGADFVVCIGALRGNSEGDRDEICDPCLRGVRHDDGPIEAALHEEESLFGSLRSGEGDSAFADPVLRHAQGITDRASVASRVLRVEEIETPALVYDLSVEGHHNFVVEGVVAHNCHRVGAFTWSPVPQKFKARWCLGLSATPRRKDGADDVFHHHIGPMLFSAKEQRMKPTVKRVWTGFKLIRTERFNPNLAKKGLVLRFLCASTARNRIIAEQMVRAAMTGRKLLVLSERLKHLEVLETLFKEMWSSSNGGVPECDYYVGGRTQAERDIARRARVILATSQFAQEGLDIPELDTLLLTTPMGDVEQAVGRILRPHPDKKSPIVVDFRDDDVPVCKASAKYRDKYYDSVA